MQRINHILSVPLALEMHATYTDWLQHKWEANKCVFKVMGHNEPPE